MQSYKASLHIVKSGYIDGDNDDGGDEDALRQHRGRAPIFLHKDK